MYRLVKIGAEARSSVGPGLKVIDSSEHLAPGGGLRVGGERLAQVDVHPARGRDGLGGAGEGGNGRDGHGEDRCHTHVEC